MLKKGKFSLFFYTLGILFSLFFILTLQYKIKNCHRIFFSYFKLLIYSDSINEKKNCFHLKWMGVMVYEYFINYFATWMLKIELLQIWKFYVVYCELSSMCFLRVFKIFFARFAKKKRNYKFSTIIYIK